MKKLLTIALLASAASAWAQGAAHVEIKDAWVRATVAQQKATGAFMQLTAKTDSRLLDVQSPVAGVAQIHEMTIVNGVMKMRQIPALALPAGQAVDLKPGGYHLMLMDLKAQVRAGDVVPLTLVFENSDGQRESRLIQVPVRPLASAMGDMKPMGHGDGKHRH